MNASRILAVMLGVLGLLAGGCETVYFEAPDPELTQKASVAALTVYAETFDTSKPMPAINWVVGRQCLEEDVSGCFDGSYDPKMDQISLIWEGSYHRSALAHEFYHVLLWRAYRDGDANHSGRGWKILVPEAEAAELVQGL